MILFANKIVQINNLMLKSCMRFTPGYIHHGSILNEPPLGMKLKFSPAFILKFNAKRLSAISNLFKILYINFTHYFVLSFKKINSMLHLPKTYGSVLNYEHI